MIYTTCFNVKKSRCVTYNNDEKKKISHEMKYYNMKCRYLNYDD